MGTVGDRYNEDKPMVSLVLDAHYGIEGMAYVLEHGLNKYSRGNWMKGLSHTEICDSLLRHVMAYLSGEDEDRESGQLHVDHIAVNGLFLADMARRRPDLDDRSVEDDV